MQHSWLEPEWLNLREWDEVLMICPLRIGLNNQQDVLSQLASVRNLGFQPILGQSCYALKDKVC